ncbi:MAG: putative membrane protein, partial [Bacteroidia bacterium]
MNFPLISAEADFALLGVLLGCVAFGFWAERKTRWGRRATGILITMTAAMILANLKIIPTDAPTYHLIWEMLLPVALPLLLFRADLRKALKEAGPTLLAFGFGIIGILAGTLVAVYLVPLGELTAPMAGMFSATYIGGGANFAAVAATIDFQQGGPYIAAIGADNIATNLVTLFLIALPGITLVSKYFENKHAAGGDASAIHMDDSIYRMKNVDLVGLAMALAAAFAMAALGMLSADLIGKPNLAILFTTAYALALANLAPAFIKRLSGDFEAGIFLIFIFLAALAASADIW